LGGERRGGARKGSKQRAAGGNVIRGRESVGKGVGWRQRGVGLKRGGDRGYRRPGRVSGEVVGGGEGRRGGCRAGGGGGCAGVGVGSVGQ